MLILWLIIIVGQIMWAIKCFGWWKNRPKWLNIVVWICVCLMLIAMFWVANS